MAEEIPAKRVNVGLSRRGFLQVAGAAALAGLRPAHAADDKPLRLMALGQSIIKDDLGRATRAAEIDALTKYLKQGDVCFTNFEMAVRGGVGSKAQKRALFDHAVDANVLDVLKDLSINLMSLANNHSYDLGAPGILHTIEETKKRGFAYAGTGKDLAAASGPGVLTIPQGKVALIAAAAGSVPEEFYATPDRTGVNHIEVKEGVANEADITRVLDSVKAAAAENDWVFVYTHNHYWEKNRVKTPGWLIELARKCIDAGAAAFINHGIPVMHGIEIYNGRPIFYCLGNFIFQTVVEKLNKENFWTVIADCEFTGKKLKSLKLRPIQLTPADEGDKKFITRGRPQFANADQAKDIFFYLKKNSNAYKTKIEPRGEFAEVTW